MIRQQVWRRRKRRDIPPNKRCIGHKWVFKKKKDGRYRARLCALGYSQIEGEDFTNTQSPVVNDISLRTVLVLSLIYNWVSEVVDITTAFLYGEMDVEVYMDVPEGIEEIEDGWNREEDVAELLRTIYGTKQAARQYWKYFITYMKSKGFKTSHVDPCLLIKKDENGTCIICVYVDDCLFIGDKKAVKAAKETVKSKFEVRELGAIDEYIGCNIKHLKNKRFKLEQPDMINKIEKQFGEDVQSMKPVETPMGPGIGIQRPTEEDKKLSKEEQTRYRSAVGMLLYLVKHSRPDLSNAVRELTKVMDGATKEHERLMRRVIKFVLQTPNRGLVMEPIITDKLMIEALSDSDYAGDKDNRRSITGYIIKLCNCVIAWKSKQQGGVCLSSSEAEYYAMSEAATEMIFVKNILEFLEEDVKMPMVLEADNQGAIFLANNTSSGSRTKHIDTRVHFVRDLVQAEDQTLQVKYVNTNDNGSDTFTKNTDNGTFWKHTSVYMIDE